MAAGLDPQSNLCATKSAQSEGHARAGRFMCEATCMCRLAPTLAAFLSKSTGICVECRSRTKRFDGRLVCHCNIRICVESVVVHNPARWRAYACSQMSFERRDTSWPGLWKAHGSCCTRFRSPCSSCGGHKFRHETRITMLAPPRNDLNRSLEFPGSQAGRSSVIGAKSRRNLLVPSAPNIDLAADMRRISFIRSPRRCARCSKMG
jgi:hypothetical protein